MSWFVDVFSFMWAIAFFVAILALLVARVVRTSKFTTENVDPLTLMHYRYNRLEEAYGWMRGAAIAGILALIMLWISVRHCG